MLSMATRDPATTVTSVVDLAWSGLEGDRMRSHNREWRASPFADQLQRGVFVFYHRHSLKEVLDTPGVMSLIKDTKAAQEVQALKEFFAMLTNDSARACYGPKHVEVAHERLAIQTLLMTDTLFRNTDIVSRRKYVNLVESVKKYGGTVHIFSSMHVSGDQLAQLTGIAAILRFPLPDLEDIEM